MPLQRRDRSVSGAELSLPWEKVLILLVVLILEGKVEELRSDDAPAKTSGCPN